MIYFLLDLLFRPHFRFQAKIWNGCYILVPKAVSFNEDAMIIESLGKMILEVIESAMMKPWKMRNSWF